MEEAALEKEKRRQRLEIRRRKRRRAAVKRLIVLGSGCVVVILLLITLFNMAASRIREKNAAGHTATASTSKEESSQTKSEAVQPEEKSSASQKYPVQTVTRDQLEEGDLVLVNEAHPLRNYGDSDLLQVNKNNEGLYTVKDNDIKLKKEALQALNEMLGDFTKEEGSNSVGVVSAYRDFETQERLHYQDMTEKKSEDTDTFVAKPDRSEHHTGLVVDLGIYQNGQGGELSDGKGREAWLNENCYKYGFIVRYQEAKKDKTGIGDEPWHFRYVGVVHATLMHDLNLCLEEYIEYLKTYRYYTNPLQPGEDAISQYSIYYVPAEGETTSVPVPKTKKYTISGNNVDGFIVTVKLK